MTPSQIEQQARETYNAVGETFWTAQEIFNLIFRGCSELAQETECIERTYTTSSVASTQEYAFPSETIAIQRVEYSGRKIRPISRRESDALTLGGTAVSVEGSPQYYCQWNETIAFFPTPGTSAETIKIYSVNMPQAIIVTSTLEVPVWTHPALVNFVLSEMYAKDKDFNSAGYYKQLWEKDKARIKHMMAKKKRRDSPAHILVEEALPNTVLGLV